MPDHYVAPGDHRPHDELGRLVPRNPIADPRVLARAVPQLASIFARAVPASHRTEGGVACVCGAETEVASARVVACAGGCSRYFLRVGDDVRVAGTPTA